MKQRSRLESWSEVAARAVLGALASACITTTARMAVPLDIAPATEVVPVEGRSVMSGLLVNENFKIGVFDVSHVSRRAKQSPHFDGLGSFQTSEESGYSYDLTNGAQNLHGECVLETSGGGASLGSATISDQHKKFSCACGNEKTLVASIVMQAQASTTNKYGGTLKARDSWYDISAIYDREGLISDGNPSGYRVDGEGVQAAVDVLGPGRVWIAKTLEGDKRADVTCVFAGLLLFKPPIRK